MKIVKIYKNGTIMLPHHLFKKLDIKEGSNLVLEEKNYGFVLCKLEVYENFLGYFEADIKQVDIEIREATTSIKNIFKRMLVKKTLIKNNYE